MERQSLLILVCILSIAGVVSLYFYASSIQAREMRISEIGSDDVGTFVETQGAVAKLWRSSGGSLNLVIMDDDLSTLNVFIPKKVYESLSGREKLLPGARIDVQGEVQKYNGELELYVPSSSSVKIVKERDELVIPLQTLASVPESFDGLWVQTEGRMKGIELLEDSDFVKVTQGNSSIWAYGCGNETTGNAVDVYAHLDYSDLRGRWELRIDPQSKDGIFKSPSETPQGYVEARISQLVSGAEGYEGQLIAVKNSTAEKGEVIGASFLLWSSSSEGYYSIECVVFDRDWEEVASRFTEGCEVRFSGSLKYYPRESRWQIATEKASTLFPAGR